jgi:hypothetical protein
MKTNLRKSGQKSPDVVLVVSWKEKGKVPEKVLRLWSDSVDCTHPVREQVVPGEALSATMEARHLTPGRYLLQLACRDVRPLTAQPPPREGAPNTLVIHVASSDDVRTDEAFRIEAITIRQGILRKLKGSYSVTILGKIVNRKLPSGAGPGNVLVKDINEAWYCGRLEVDADVAARSETEIDKTNPVKVEYSPDRGCVTAIEDRHGDGAMFCADCGRLYWDSKQLKGEESQRHALHGPITMFHIRWIP